MQECIHDMLFFDPIEGIQEDQKGLYRNWYCSKCGKAFKNRNLSHIGV